MADWNPNNLACANTWAFLRGLGELRPNFSGSEQLRVSDLKFWNLAASPEMRAQEARALASRLDRLFVKALFAKYEDDFTMASAVDAITGNLTQAGTTLPTLAATVDEAYRFKGELS